MAIEKSPEVTTIDIESIGLLEIDKAVHDFFNVKNSLKLNNRKVPVLFGAWERFVQMQGNRDDDNLNSLRDKNGMLKLPIISLRRESIEPSEERYLKNTHDGETSLKFTTKIAGARFANRRVPYTGSWLAPTKVYKKTDPVYEVHSLPFPSFVNIPYVITFWSSYVKHANMFHDKIWKEFHPEDINYKGLFFYSHFESSTDESNMEDFSAEERIIRHTFNMQVQGYLIDKSEVKVDRTTSKFHFEERLIDLDDEVRDNETSFL